MQETLREPVSGPGRPQMAGTKGRVMTTKAQVLIVEDEPNVRLVFRTTLEENGLALSTAEDGETALGWLKQSKCDLVLLDLKMPGVGGMETLRRLRDAGNAVPVVIITAHGTIPDSVEAMKLGAVDFLTKPVTPEARKVVADVLSRHKPRPAAPREPAADTLMKAKREMNLREFDKADDLLGMLELNPRSAEAHYLKGVLHGFLATRDTPPTPTGPPSRLTRRSSRPGSI